MNDYWKIGIITALLKILLILIDFNIQVVTLN